MIVKLAMFIKIIFSGIFALLSVISVNAMDAEFAGYTHQKAQVMGTKYKKELAAEKLKPIVAAAPVSFAGTDTELLIRGITDGNNNAYVADVKPKIIALVDTWVENLRVGNADIVTGARGVRKKNTFRAAIQAAINTKAVVTASAVDADIITLKATKEAIKTEIADAAVAYIHGLGAAAADAGFLDVGVVVSGAAGPLVPGRLAGLGDDDKPLDRTRTAFENAIRAKIMSF